MRHLLLYLMLLCSMAGSAQDEIVYHRIKKITVNGVSLDMIEVRGGTFNMGATYEQGDDASDFEEPVHQVTLSSYYIGKYEVTQELWRTIMGDNPSKHVNNKKPVEHVSWNDCQNFISKLNSLTGKRFRLPSEAEWEFAARGGGKSKGYKYSGSNSLDNVAWFDNNSGATTHEVGTKSPNELGIYDMSGNVWEWCQDRLSKYSSSSQINPIVTKAENRHIFRGGGCYNEARFCRSSNRTVPLREVTKFQNLGLRLVLSVE